MKGDMLETAVVGEIAHKPAYFVPGNSWLWLLQSKHDSYINNSFCRFDVSLESSSGISD